MFSRPMRWRCAKKNRIREGTQPKRKTRCLLCIYVDEIRDEQDHTEVQQKKRANPLL